MSIKIKEYPGVALSEEDIKEKKVFSVPWDPALRYSFDTGIAIGRFLLELKQGRIIGTKCHKCRRVVVPPRVYCEWCFKPMEEWVYLKDTGRVNTFSICYVLWDATRVKEPTIPAIIEIDGASPGVGFLHYLGEIEPDPEKIKIGMRVKAVWKPPEEREAAITDIKYFKPIEEEK